MMLTSAIPSSLPNQIVPEVLREYGALTRRELLRYLPSREPRRYLYDLVADYPKRGGKMMRSSLCIATTKAFGGRAEDALGTAPSVELRGAGTESR